MLRVRYIICGRGVRLRKEAKEARGSAKEFVTETEILGEHVELSPAMLPIPKYPNTRRNSPWVRVVPDTLPESDISVGYIPVTHPP